MDPYKVQLTREAAKDLKRIPGSARLRAMRELLLLETDPLAGKPLAGSLQDCRSLRCHIDAVSYRAAYRLLTGVRTCLVFHVGTRQSFYDEAARCARSL